MQIMQTDLPGLQVLTPSRYEDNRGFFSETWNQKTLIEAGIKIDFVQDNESLSREAGTLRGLHYQSPPFAQTKLVRVVSGAVLDVAVDVRTGSPKYGDWYLVELSAKNAKQLLVPRGFLHGFITLQPDTHVIYKVDGFYNAKADGNIIWNDNTLNIDWGVSDDEVKLSQKDIGAPNFSDWVSPFQYEA